MALPNISLLGPILPYRGGIAQYTTVLSRKLKSRCNLQVVSFKRQYPKLLFPGKSNYDPDYTNYKEEDVKYALDSLNPLSWISTFKLIKSHNPHSVIIPWWTVYWAPCFFSLTFLFKKNKIKIIFLCHNIIEHESAKWKLFLTKLVLSNGNHFIVHSQSDADDLSELVQNRSIAVFPMPAFTNFPSSKGLLPRRAKLELLFYGFVRYYKGLDILIKAMQLMNQQDVFLSIVGEWWGDNSTLKNLIEHSEVKNKIEIVDRYVNEQETAEYFSRCDVVILPYRSVTGTAIIPLAYHYGKPVIASRIGGLPDIVKDGVTGKLINSEDPDALSKAICDFLDSDLKFMQDSAGEFSKKMTWDSIVNHILSLSNSNE